MRWLRNPCRRYRESICLVVCGALPEAEKAGVENHLAACAGCRQYYEEMSVLTVPLANWDRVFAGVEPAPAAQRRWTRAIEAAVAPSSARQSARMNVFAKLWLEIVWPARRIWAGLAAVWVALAICNFTQAGRGETVVAKTAVPAMEMRLAFQEQQRLLAEILGSPPAAAPAEPPRRSPQPRSDRRDKFTMA